MSKLDQTSDLMWILGRPSFWCCNFAQLLRNTGQKIECKAEAEQAAVIYWMLGFYLDDSLNWRMNWQRDIRGRLILLGVNPDQ